MSQEYQWEDFKDRNVRFDARIPRLTIQRKGNMGMNVAAFEALGSPSRIVFRYDKNRRAIAIRPAALDEKGSYPVKKQQLANSYVLSAKAFTAFLGLNTDELKVYSPKVVNGMLVVDLNEEITDDEGEE